MKSFFSSFFFLFNFLYCVFCFGTTYNLYICVLRLYPWFACCTHPLATISTPHVLPICMAYAYPMCFSCVRPACSLCVRLHTSKCCNPLSNLMPQTFRHFLLLGFPSWASNIHPWGSLVSHGPCQGWSVQKTVHNIHHSAQFLK